MFTLSRDELILILDALEWNLRATVVDQQTDYVDLNESTIQVIKKVKHWASIMDHYNESKPLPTIISLH